MHQDSITIPVKIDGKQFHDFAVFDTLHRQKRWKSPAVFTGILALSACICFAMHQRADQAILMGCVLLGIAIIVPGVYFFMFFRSITQQIQKMHIQKPTAVYTVRLCAPPQGITITWPQKKTPPLSCRWESVCRVYRNKNCIYLFTAENQAFLLPEGQADTDTDTLWEFLVKHAGVEKAIVL